eukprot:g2138.t1
MVSKRGDDCDCILDSSKETMNAVATSSGDDCDCILDRKSGKMVREANLLISQILKKNLGVSDKDETMSAVATSGDDCDCILDSKSGKMVSKRGDDCDCILDSDKDETVSAVATSGDDCDCILDSKSGKMVSKRGDDCDCILDSKKVSSVAAPPSPAKKGDDCDCILDSKSGKLLSKKGDDCDCILDSKKVSMISALAFSSSNKKGDDCDCILDSKSGKLVSKKGDDCDCILDSKKLNQKKGDDCDCILDSKSGRMVTRRGDDCDCILDGKKVSAVVAPAAPSSSKKGDDCDCILDSKAGRTRSKKGDDCDCILDGKKLSTVASSSSSATNTKKGDDCDCILDGKSGKMVTKRGDDCDCILGGGRKGKPSSNSSSGTSTSKSKREKGEKKASLLATIHKNKHLSKQKKNQNLHYRLKGKNRKTGNPCACTLDGKLPGEDDDCDCVLDSPEAKKIAPKNKQHTTSDDDDDEDEEDDGDDSNRLPPSAVRLDVQPLLNQPGATAPTAAAAPAAAPAASEAAPAPVATQGACSEIDARIQRLRAEIALWSDHATWNQKIAADKAVVATETTAGMADMLADIRYELHQITVPILVEVLADKLEMLTKEHEACESGEGKQWEKVDGSGGEGKAKKAVKLETVLAVLGCGGAIVLLVWLPQSWYRDQQFFLALHRRELIFDLNPDDDIKHELHVKGVSKWLVEAVKQCDNGPSYTNTSGSRASGPTHTIAVPAKNIFYRPPPAAAKNYSYPADGSLFPFPGTPGSRAGELVFIAGLKNKPDFEGAQVFSLIRPEEFLVLRPPPTTIDGSRELRRNDAVPIDDTKGGGVVTHDTGFPETSECMPRFRVMSLVAKQEEQRRKLAAFLKVRPVNAVLAETEQRLDVERRGGGSEADHHFQALDHEERELSPDSVVEEGFHMQVKGVSEWLVEAVKHGQCGSGTHTISVPAKNIFYRPAGAGVAGGGAGEFVFIAGLKDRPEFGDGWDGWGFEGAQVVSLIRPKQFLVLRYPEPWSEYCRPHHAVPMEGGGGVFHKKFPETSQRVPRAWVMSFVERKRKELAAI